MNFNVNQIVPLQKSKYRQTLKQTTVVIETNDENCTPNNRKTIKGTLLKNITLEH